MSNDWKEYDNRHGSRDVTDAIVSFSISIVPTFWRNWNEEFLISVSRANRSGSTIDDVRALRPENGKHGAAPSGAHRTSKSDTSSVLLDDRLSEPQAQTRADVFFGRIKGFEYPGAMRLTDSNPIVTDADVAKLDPWDLAIRRRMQRLRYRRRSSVVLLLGRRTRCICRDPHETDQSERWQRCLDDCDGDCFAGLQEAEQVLVVDGFLAVGEFGEAGVDFADLVAVERVAEFFETVG
jgi:hypothetical protein